jgi:hypothetical protein
MAIRIACDSFDPSSCTGPIPSFVHRFAQANFRALGVASTSVDVVVDWVVNLDRDGDCRVIANGRVAAHRCRRRR